MSFLQMSYSQKLLINIYNINFQKMVLGVSKLINNSNQCVDLSTINGFKYDEKRDRYLVSFMNGRILSID